MPDQHDLPEGVDMNDEPANEEEARELELGDGDSDLLEDIERLTPLEAPMTPHPSGGYIRIEDLDLPAIRAAAVEEERERRREALGKFIASELPCDCPAGSELAPEQHADECAVGVGFRILAALDQEDDRG